MEIIGLRQKFLDHFSAAGYLPQLASSLVPENDPSVLFTTAGMQQYKLFYTAPETAPAPKLVTVQPVIRTSDIAEVGDNTHLTSFEMLGIFSFGQSDAVAMKKDAIEAMWSFIRDELQVDPKRVYATVFGGDNKTPRDDESAKIWQELVVEVKDMGREDNFWGPTGDEGPCGPNTEIYIDGIEIGNIVFNQYYQDAGKQFTLLKEFGLDFGAGLERFSATLQEQNSIWAIEPFQTWVSHTDPTKAAESRVIIDHLRAAIFIISAGVLPANKGREYVLRRLIRKAVFLVDGLSRSFDWEVAINHIHNYYAAHYSLEASQEILDVIIREKDQFEKNLARAKNYLEKWLEQTAKADQKQITELAFYHPEAEQTGEEGEAKIKNITELAFYMYESFGFPKELVVEYLKGLGHDVDVDLFAGLFATHQEVSRSGAAGQFKGGLADNEAHTIKHHTAHHLLLAALQQVLGKDVVQKGSNVTQERLRIDFNFDRKVTDEEIRAVETIVNEKIAADLPVEHAEMNKDEALNSGAQAEFGAKYGDTFSVYTIGDFSKELCGGPHVERTSELGQFEILKEEASSQGIRRIKARLI